MMGDVAAATAYGGGDSCADSSELMMETSSDASFPMTQSTAFGEASSISFRTDSFANQATFYMLLLVGFDVHLILVSWISLK